MINVTIRRISYAGILIFWLATMLVLVTRHYGLNYNLKPVFSKIIIPKELYDEQWMGVYYKGEKIGYSSRKIEKLDKAYKISEALKIKINVMGSIKDIETTTEAYLDADFALTSFGLALKSDASMNIKGMVEGKKLKVTIDALGNRSAQTITLKEKPILEISVIPNILKDGMKKGKKFNMTIFEPSTFTQERMLVEILGKEQIMSMGFKQEAFKLKASFKGIELFTWLSDKGEVLREESPMGFTLIKETRETAKQIGKPSLDLIAQAAVPFNLKLPRDVSYIKLKLSGIDFKGLELDGGRQRFKGDILEIKKEVLGAEVRSQKSEVSDEYMKDTMFIQSKDPQIISMAKEIVKVGDSTLRDEKDPLNSARLIYEWVYKNIEKTAAITIPMATEVLKTKRGDCNEHTILFTALARAAGIPARIAIGLTYKDGFFYYHAWPEIFYGGWIAVDPTLGQFPAGAAHIRFVTGDIDRQVQILSVIGRVKIEGLEFR